LQHDKSKSVAIHSKSFHQQIEMTAMVGKKFMWIVGKHRVKLKKVTFQKPE